MDDFIKNLKDTLGGDNVVGFMKDEKVNDENPINEEDVRRALEKTDPNNIIDAGEMASKLNEISEQSSAKMQDGKNQPSQLVGSIKSNFSVLQKSSPTDQAGEEDNPYTKNDHILAFFD